MRTGLMISIVLLCATIAAGCWEEHETAQLSGRYAAMAESVGSLARAGDWQQAEAAVSACMAEWQRIVPWLQILINHEDIDDVTLALERLRAAVEAQETSACQEICAELKENARHIHHRDAFTLGNVL